MVDRLPSKWRKIVVGVSGGSVLVVGIIAIPYPGPGWLIVFAGLAILAKEFPWAARALKFGRDKYDDWNKWIKRQNWFIKSLTFIGTTIVVVLTLWLVNAYGLINGWFNLGIEWLNSPILRK
ncbi:MAG TPA: TIGR02611 family protein [Candidatus Saccharimonadales bacterium]